MVRSCNRLGCNNIMCSRYSYLYGYICNECFEELVLSRKSIEEFMKTEKNLDKIFENMDDRRNRLDKIFENME